MLNLIPNRQCALRVLSNDVVKLSWLGIYLKLLLFLLCIILLKSQIWYTDYKLNGSVKYYVKKLCIFNAVSKLEGWYDQRSVVAIGVQGKMHTLQGLLPCHLLTPLKSPVLLLMIPRNQGYQLKWDSPYGLFKSSIFTHISMILFKLFFSHAAVLSLPGNHPQSLAYIPIFLVWLIFFLRHSFWYLPIYFPFYYGSFLLCALFSQLHVEYFESRNFEYLLCNFVVPIRE